MLYYKTNRTSRSGKALLEVVERMEMCQEAQNNFAQSLGASEFRGIAGVAYGGISKLYFTKTPNLRLFKLAPDKDGYVIAKKGKLAKQLANRMAKLPTVSVEVVHKALGLKISQKEGFKMIGLNFNNPKLFLFTLHESWGVKVRKDCPEIDEAEFENLRNFVE